MLILKESPNLKSMNLEALKPLLSRKFLMAVLCTLLGILFVDVPGEAKLEFLKWLLGIYVSSNVIQKAAVK